MKRSVILLVGLILPTLTFSQSITEIIDDHIVNGTYETVEGKWVGSTKMTVYYDKELAGSNTLPKQTTLLFFKDKGIIKGSSSTSLTDAVIELTGGNNGSYLAFMPFKGYQFVKGAAKNANNSLTVILEYRRILQEGIIESSFIEWELRKQYPLSNDIEAVRLKEIERRKKEIEDAPKSGTGFAISSNGYVITNYHVVENAKKIRIKGINGDFNRSYEAEIIQEDKLNDLAIVKINDDEFTSIGIIPFKIKTSTSEVGEDVFVLGYPLTATMGEEVKLTTGVVSSRTGFQGSVTQYQISAPIQPGNSGGPLFDKSGNLIGIISAKHNNTQNVGYAIKASYLQNLIDVLPEKIATSNSIVLNKALSQQVKLIKNFVFIIEINQN